MVVKKKPYYELPAGYVPPNSAPFIVSGSSPKWNWASVAAHHKLPDVWKDLIEFNFPTVAFEPTFQDKCAAVNWYLGERLKCVNTTLDGKNDRFEGAANGTIYIPKVVTNDVGRRAAKSVTSVLGDHLNCLNFVLGGVSIHPTFFHQVRRAILDGKIGIEVNPAGMDPGSEAPGRRPPPGARSRPGPGRSGGRRSPCPRCPARRPRWSGSTARPATSRRRSDPPAASARSGPRSRTARWYRRSARPCSEFRLWAPIPYRRHFSAGIFLP
jgi:hypothetical protein